MAVWRHLHGPAIYHAIMYGFKRNFYGLAVKTGSIALHKVFFLSFFLGLAQKVGYLGSIFCQIRLKKLMGKNYPSFFYIFTIFGVKNVCELFREID